MSEIELLTVVMFMLIPICFALALIVIGLYSLRPK
jgi:hypothetical protein